MGGEGQSEGGGIGELNRFSSVSLDLNHSNYGGRTVICTGYLLAPTLSVLT